MSDSCKLGRKNKKLLEKRAGKMPKILEECFCGIMCQNEQHLI